MEWTLYMALERQIKLNTRKFSMKMLQKTY